MKKYIIIIAFISFLFNSCDIKEKYENEESKVVSLAGEWWVQYNHADYGEDPFGAGFTPLLTFNASADDGAEVWLSDEGNFWDYKVKIPVNVSGLTFGSATPVTSVIDGYDIQVIIENGKIMEGVSEQASGFMADSIYFEVWFEDLEGATGIADDRLLVSGFRRTGFLEDEH